jgi:hypothetical protein
MAGLPPRSSSAFQEVRMLGVLAGTHFSSVEPSGAEADFQS